MIHSIFDPISERTVMALGFFDSLHKGHRALIAECTESAKRLGVKSAAVTFRNNPFESLGAQTKLVYTFSERIKIFESIGVDYVVAADFDEDFKRISAIEYLNLILRCNPAGIVCGGDYRFGFNNDGNLRVLRDFADANGIPLKMVNEITRDGRRVSSSEIRRMISAGDIVNANILLGGDYFIASKVVRGRQIGRRIGFPTANLILSREKLVPKHGVYAAKATIDEKSYKAVLHIGEKPTYNEPTITAEAHLTDFEGELYGVEITVFPRIFLRENKRFRDENELIKQLETDVDSLKGFTL